MLAVNAMLGKAHYCIIQYNDQRKHYISMGVDPFTLFAANAVILIVTAISFLAAWQGNRHEAYWGSWFAANTTLAAAIILFMLSLRGVDGLTMMLANCFLVAGFGLRWRAARQFGGRSGPLTPIVVLTLFTVVLFAIPMLFDYGVVYTAVNVILATQCAAITYEFWRDRQDGLPSRHALVMA